MIVPADKMVMGIGPLITIRTDDGTCNEDRNKA
jgi:hypothetical protein